METETRCRNIIKSVFRSLFFLFFHSDLNTTIYNLISSCSDFQHVSLMKPVDINPNDEWINVSKHIFEVLSMFSYSIPFSSLFKEFHPCSLLLPFFSYHMLLLLMFATYSVVDGHGWNISTDMYPLIKFPRELDRVVT